MNSKDLVERFTANLHQVVDEMPGTDGQVRRALHLQVAEFIDYAGTYLRHGGGGLYKMVERDPQIILVMFSCFCTGSTTMLVAMEKVAAEEEAAEQAAQDYLAKMTGGLQ